MSDEMSPEMAKALRSALGHLESQAPEAPRLPTETAMPVRRFWSKPAVVIVAFAAAALIALPGLWWLGSDDATGPDSSTTSDATPTSTTEPGTTAASTTVVTLPAGGTGIEFGACPTPPTPSSRETWWRVRLPRMGTR